ncbi:ORF39 peptide [Hyphantria cunea nucleopolyhedrovirus]|uniref:ORF39 peptide n=1 Tax=Hyphantria cunea nuclear polyhedrosis virus TaxID=28288 RepID=Q2NNV0_NPVHC|nr:ORF39 peptide [Hyphantria cunea nucleopolyhedrovirus]BAE72328.1 ORF39 peptide [Hyphantria cunea nucleopolyhedrovirus]
MPTVWQLLLLIVIVAIVYVYAFGFVRQFVQEDAVEKQQAAAAPLMEFTFQRARGVDCALNRLPCVTNQQCRDNCVIASAASNLACDNGFCSANNGLEGAQPPDARVECDTALGLLRVYAAGGDFVVAQTCVSTYRDLVDDTGAPRPYLCDGGALQLNLDTVQFSADACTCAAGYEKMLFRQTALARAVPVCIPSRMSNLYRRVYV